MSLSAPAPPNPYAVAAAQEGVNQQAAQQQAEINDVNQVTPYGNLTYTQTGTNPDGTPKFTATTALNPAEQNLFNTTVNTQQGAATAAGNLIKNLGSSLSSAPNLGNDSLINTLMGWQTKYMQPFFNQQTSNLNSRLANEGLAPDSTAATNATYNLQQNQDAAIEAAMAGDEGLAYNQGLTSYEAPIQTLSTLLGEGSPANLNASLANTPQESIQPANLESDVQNAYNSQLQNYSNTMNGLFGLGSALAGGWAKAGFPV